ncbi:MAG: hypothetical protein FWF79_03720 [Defluviitaleaceae bacterium]|nr:hypothetical protein [Defluviitaleaceae bacterium]
MLNTNKGFITLVFGASAAAVAVLSVGGYLLHKKVLKYRLQEQARRLVMFGIGEEYEDEYDDDYEDGDDEYCDKLFDEFDEDGFYNTAPQPAPVQAPTTERRNDER